MVKVTVRKPTMEDVKHLADNMRQCDVNEIFAISDLTPLEMVLSSVQDSDKRLCVAVFADDELVCIYGCSTRGNPWMMATTAMDNHGYELTKRTRRIVRRMLKVYPHLWNAVDIRSEENIRWLKIIGFKFTGDTIEVKPGRPLLIFEKVKS